MPAGLKRYQQSGDFHFLTFSCDGRRPYLESPDAKHQFEVSLETTRALYSFHVFGYVVMPEHVHLLVSEPQTKTLATAMQALKQSVSRKIPKTSDTFWYTRYYDFNVKSDDKTTDELRYMHCNPVKRGLVARPQDWPWSSYRHYATGERGIIEIESWWTEAERCGLTIPEKFSEEIGHANQ